MNEKYVIIDVETPNEANDRISAIGVVTVENGVISDKFHTLVDPETHFDDFNIELTGITPDSVCGMPKFDEVWDKIGRIINGAVIVAHNAVFDLGVIKKCFGAYGVSHERYLNYICTYRVGKLLFPHLPNHKLNTMCDYFGLELDHHNALSDALGCAGLLLEYERKVPLSGLVKQYDTLKFSPEQKKRINFNKN